MPSKLCDIYMAKTIEELDQRASVSAQDLRSISNQPIIKAVEQAVKLYRNADVYFREGDEERAYVLYRRTAEILLHLAKSKRADDRKYISQMAKRELENSLEHSEKLKNSLIRRYQLYLESDQRENSKIPEPDSIEVPPLLEKANDNHNDVKASSSTVEPDLKTDLTAKELYEWLQKNRSYLLIDCRPENDFNESHIKSEAIISVPSSVLRPGCIAQHLEAQIPMQYRKLFYQRRSFEYVILFDWSSASISDNSPLKFLFDALNLYDSKGRLRNQPLLLRGGYQEFLLHYPTICTKAVDASKISSSTSKFSSNMMAETYSAADIAYPDFATLSSGPANRVPLPNSAINNLGADGLNTNGASSFSPKSEAEHPRIPLVDRSNKPRTCSPDEENAGLQGEYVMLSFANGEKSSPKPNPTASYPTVSYPNVAASFPNAAADEFENHVSSYASTVDQANDRYEKLEEIMKKLKSDAEARAKADAERLEQTSAENNELRRQLMAKEEAEKLNEEQMKKLERENAVEKLRREREKQKNFQPEEKPKNFVPEEPKKPPEVKIEPSNLAPKPSNLAPKPLAKEEPLKPKESIPNVVNHLKPSGEASLSSMAKFSNSTPNLAKDLETSDELAKENIPVPHGPSIPDRTKKPLNNAENDEVFKRNRILGGNADEYSAAELRNMQVQYGSAERYMGLTGLQNLGNTCYMNSIIQCLSSSLPLIKYFVLEKRYKRDLNEGNPLGTGGDVAKHFASVIEFLWRGHACISPIDFKKCINRHHPAFNNNCQQDSSEFLIFVLDSLHEDLNRIRQRRQNLPEQNNDGKSDAHAAQEAWMLHIVNNQSIIIDLFNGQLKSTLTCLSCRKQSVTFDTLMYLSLPIASTRTVDLDACIKMFFEPEYLSGHSRWKCPNCKCPRDAEKSITLWRLPKILIIHLKRFHSQGYRHDKLGNFVEFPIDDLRLSDPSRNCTVQYSLYAVSEHIGHHMEGGHYIAYCRHPLLNKWFKYDDTEATPCSKETVARCRAYTLFYSCDPWWLK